MKLHVTSLLVADQEHALQFYRDTLGFEEQHDIPMGGARWLTVFAPAGTREVAVLLEPTLFAPAAEYQRALFDAGIPATSLAVDDCRAEVRRLRELGVVFRGEPQDMGGNVMATFEDTCGNLIQLVEVA